MPALEEATYVLFKSYEALDMVTLRDDTRRIMDKTYPSSRYLAGGFKTVDKPWYKFW